MCPSYLGRVQTRWAIIILPAIIAAIISLISDQSGWIVLIGIYFVLGVALDTVFYPYVIRWQPPWLTFTLAVGEFVLLYIVAHIVKVKISNLDAVILYWCVWVLAIWTKVAILPLISLGWIENAGEFRQTGWSVSPEYIPLALTVFTPPVEGDGPPALAREFSSLREVPKEILNLPAPSGIQSVPQGLR
jgi:hypothetical protein